MAGWAPAGKTLQIAALPSAPMISLHSADPGTTGASELTGGSPAYAKKTGALAAASGTGPVTRALTVASAHDVASGSTVAFVGIWDAAGTTFLGSFSVTSETYGGQGTYQVDSSSLSIN